MGACLPYDVNGGALDTVVGHGFWVEEGYGFEVAGHGGLAVVAGHGGLGVLAGTFGVVFGHGSVALDGVLPWGHGSGVLGFGDVLP